MLFVKFCVWPFFDETMSSSWTKDTLTQETTLPGGEWETTTWTGREVPENRWLSFRRGLKWLCKKVEKTTVKEKVLSKVSDGVFVS